MYYTLSPHFKIFLTPKGTQQQRLLYAKNLQYAYCRTVARRRRPHTHTLTHTTSLVLPKEPKEELELAQPSPHSQPKYCICTTDNDQRYLPPKFLIRKRAFQNNVKWCQKIIQFQIVRSSTLFNLFYLQLYSDVH